MLRILTVLILCLTLFQAKAQTCSIVSANYVCREELMSFDVTASGAISSVSWDMGDATSSTQQKFNHKYSATGKYTVKVTVNLSGGGTATDTKQITVYELPKINILLKADNSYCLYQNKICLIDSSTGGDSGVKVKKRVIIWDDGTQSIDNSPQKGDIICHNYTYSSTFKITIEITNDKDCKSQKVISITILKDIIPEMYVISPNNIVLKYCDSAKTEFYDINNKDTANIINRIYDWGDGSPKITTKSKKIVHFYQKSGTYVVRLSYVQKNGCITTKDSAIDVTVYSVKFNLTKNAYSQCIGSVWRFTQLDPYYGAYYKWFLNDTILNPLPQDQLNAKWIDLSPSVLGKFKVSVNINNFGCIRTSHHDSFENKGIILLAAALNNDQCVNKDTVFLVAKIKNYGTSAINYFWDFDDNKAPQCTTNRKKGIGVNNNCNFAVDSIGKHFYISDSCRSAVLTASDTLSGCMEQISAIAINVRKPKTIQFDYYADRLCVGDKSDYYVGFKKNFCDLIKVQTNLDSTCDKDKWSNNFIFRYAYKKTCDKDRWITAGFTTTFGSDVIYTGFDTKKDFYIDKSRVCTDTTWKHNWFQLGADPVASFKPEPKCLNQVMRPVILDSIQKNISFAIWQWGDTMKWDTIIVNKGDSLIPRPGHIYTQTGTYFITYYLENQSRCYGFATQKLNAGFDKQFFLDTVICPGSKVMLIDSMCYMDFTKLIPQSKNYSHIAGRKQKGLEEFKWDFGDGRGFATDTARPVIKFPKPGFYTLKFAVKDSLQCWDTITRKINVGAVHAGIKKITGKILCDGIVQLYDSSYSDYKPPTDSISKYYWEFGDNGNPSYVANPIHHYGSLGAYTIFQQVENSRGCRDTAYIKVVVEGPEANFEIVGDSVGCAPFTAEFKNTSIRTSDYIWFFGDSLKTKISTKSNANFKFTYTKPGIYYIYLYASDSVVNAQTGTVYYCNSFFPDTTLPNYPVRRIIVLPVPKTDFTVNPILCINQPIEVTDKSDSIYKVYKWAIRNIDSITTANKTGQLISKDTGTFNIKFTPSYPPMGQYNKTCPDTVIKKVRITEIRAEFEVYKDTSSCPVFTFTNKTKGFKTIKWNLGDSLSAENTIADKNEIIHTYNSKTGTFYPCLMTENAEGCKDTLCKEVEVAVVNKLIIPNVFTPGNDDKLNDAFDIVASGMDEYDLVIYNRWGQLVFHGTKDGKGNDGNNWTGRLNATSSLYPDGTYFYIFNYKFNCEDKKQQAHGIITLIGKE